MSIVPYEGPDIEKAESNEKDAPSTSAEGHGAEVQQSKTKRLFGTKEHTTVRGMKSRHLTFIAIGGTIGTGLFLSAGTSVATAGAGGALVSYAIVGLFVYGVVLNLGEMSSLIPVSGAFAEFGGRFLGPSFEFCLGWSYFLQWSFSIPSELVAASVILSYWTDKLQSWEWSIIIIVPVFVLQLINVRAYAESEYWLALIKVITVVVFVIVGLIYDWGGVIGHPGPGLSNFNDAPFYGGFAGLCESFTYAFYSFGGVELVALAAGESQKPHKSVPRAIKATFYRIILFYIMTVLVIGLCINHNDDTLFAAYDNSDVAASPVTTVFKKAGFGAAVHVVNGVLLTAVLSATNSCFYASSRMLLSLAKGGNAPSVFGYVTARGVPVPALLYVIDPQVKYRTNLALLTWISICIINIRFRMAFKAQGRSLSDLPFKAPLFPILPIVAIILGILMFAAQGWAATTYDDGEVAKDVIAVYIGLVLFFGFLFGHMIYHKVTAKGAPMFIPLLECDFETGAVWGRGGGDAMRQQEALEQANSPAAKRWWWIERVRDKGIL
ncbi:hypothetical protein P7C70_g5470, partial [Phenoliferia sp. Uapishka_3]